MPGTTKIRRGRGALLARAFGFTRRAASPAKKAASPTRRVSSKGTKAPHSSPASVTRKPHINISAPRRNSSFGIPRASTLIMPHSAFRPGVSNANAFHNAAFGITKKTAAPPTIRRFKHSS